MSWFGIFYHPVWVCCTALLAFVVRLQRRGPWDPRGCTVRLRGKTAIVTGANTGIGKCIALDFARRGARVILACRSESRGAAALKEIRERTGNSDVHLRLVDLSSLDSVRDFAKGILEEEKALHILVNNAAVSGLPREITKDGLDVSFATNHLGPFLLTNLLLAQGDPNHYVGPEGIKRILYHCGTRDNIKSFADLMKDSAPSRIVTVSSVNHFKGQVDFSHFHGENLTYHMDYVYNHTKLHNVICTNELARRLQGTGVTANSVHPGIVMTEVMRHYPLMFRCLFNLIGFFFFKSSDEGAVSTIYCAVAEEMEGITGKYVDSDCHLVRPAPLACDPALGVKDFEISERLTSKL